MIDAFASEWIKLRRRILMLGTYGTIVTVAIVVTVLTFTSTGSQSSNLLATTAQLRGSGGAMVGLATAIPILGAVAFAVAASQTAMEYSLGTLRCLLVRQPRRYVVLAGKYLAVVTFVLAGIAIASVASVITAMIMAHAQSISTDLWTTSGGLWTDWIDFIDLILAIVGYVTFGVMLGLLLRSSVAAVAIGVVYLLPVEQFLATTIKSSVSFLPGQLLSAVADGGTAMIGYQAALLRAMAYVFLSATVGALIFLSRDVDV